MRLYQGEQVSGQLFAIFDPPLIKRIDAPENALNKSFVFIEGDHLAQRIGCEAGEQQGGRGLVAWKYLEGCELGNLFVSKAVVLHVVLRFCQSFSAHQGLALGKAVGKQGGLVIGNRAIWLNKSNEVAGD